MLPSLLAHVQCIHLCALYIIIMEFCWLNSNPGCIVVTQHRQFSLFSKVSIFDAFNSWHHSCIELAEQTQKDNRHSHTHTGTHIHKCTHPQAYIPHRTTTLLCCRLPHGKKWWCQAWCFVLWYIYTLSVVDKVQASWVSASIIYICDTSNMRSHELLNCSQKWPWSAAPQVGLDLSTVCLWHALSHSLLLCLLARYFYTCICIWLQAIKHTSTCPSPELNDTNNNHLSSHSSNNFLQDLFYNISISLRCTAAPVSHTSNNTLSNKLLLLQHILQYYSSLTANFNLYKLFLL